LSPIGGLPFQQFRRLMQRESANGCAAGFRARAFNGTFVRRIIF
jgi:hypothetical protein